jgi:hypothetical protein
LFPLMADGLDSFTHGAKLLLFVLSRFWPLAQPSKQRTTGLVSCAASQTFLSRFDRTPARASTIVTRGQSTNPRPLIWWLCVLNPTLEVLAEQSDRLPE